MQGAIKGGVGATEVEGRLLQAMPRAEQRQEREREERKRFGGWWRMFVPKIDMSVHASAED